VAVVMLSKRRLKLLQKDLNLTDAEASHYMLTRL